MEFRECPYPALMDAINWYRWFIDKHDPDHHLTFHRIKSGGLDKRCYGYVRFAQKVLDLHKEFILSIPTRDGLDSAVRAARRYRDSIPTKYLLAKKVPNQDCFTPCMPGISRIEYSERRKVWRVSHTRKEERLLRGFRISKYGEAEAMSRAINVKKEKLLLSCPAKPRLIVEKYGHLFD